MCPSQPGKLDYKFKQCQVDLKLYTEQLNIGLITGKHAYHILTQKHSIDNTHTHTHLGMRMLGWFPPRPEMSPGLPLLRLTVPWW